MPSEPQQIEIGVDGGLTDGLGGREFVDEPIAFLDRIRIQRPEQ